MAQGAFSMLGLNCEGKARAGKLGFSIWKILEAVLIHGIHGLIFSVLDAAPKAKIMKVFLRRAKEPNFRTRDWGRSVFKSLGHETP